MNPSRTRVLLAALALAAPGCAANTPVLYPNSHLQQVGPEQAQADSAACVQYAREYARANPSAKVVGRAAESAVVGGATGAVGGAIVGRPGTGAAIGAATATTASFVRGLFSWNDLSPTERQFADQCLRDRGYQPIGWK